jgi:DUF971 family protein
MTHEPKPITCVVDPKRGLMYVKWQDQHESLIPLADVRQNCPCIQCGEVRRNADPLRVLQPEQARPSSEPVGVRELGNHALQIFWSDGHEAGLYGWPLIRSLCPCEACKVGKF